ncbi:MAG UNVERIFIED_CONTAM: hypothetical protein LVT10_08765 [Anaerolineae bacterium]
MHISTYTQFSLFEDLKTEWNPLLRRSYADSIFMTWEWCSTWWQAYQPGGLWVHAVQSERGNCLRSFRFSLNNKDKSVWHA